MKYSASPFELIRKRRSVRSYSNEKLSSEVLDKISDILNHYSIGPFGNIVSFHLIEKSWARENFRVKLGTYGFISGAAYFIVGEVKDGDHCFEDFGFLLEKIILHLTELNLGTCWLGGTFKRDEYKELLNSAPDLLIPAITPVGIPEDKTFFENLIRWGAKSDSRKDWNDLFFDKDFSANLNQVEILLYQKPLEMLRLAPSASNKQPWRIIKSGDNFHFYLKRTPGYGKFGGMDLQKIDMGIAMAHFEVTCEYLGLKGKWTINNPNIAANGAEYIVSWV
jgi:nitroreductase